MAFLISKDFNCDYTLTLNCSRNCDFPISYSETELRCLSMVLLEEDIKKLIKEEGYKYGLYTNS